MKVLDLFCGGGGASEGYVRAGHEVVGVDIDRQPAYPYDFVRGDALAFVQRFGEEFDFIHASPPCQPYSKAVSSSSSRWNDTKGKDEPALIRAVRILLMETGRPYVIENVTGARAELQSPRLLCGSMFGLVIPRHRLFEGSEELQELPWPDHPNCQGIAARAAEQLGWEYRDMSVTGKGRRKGWSERAAYLLDIHHPMRQHDYKEAIPPAYTEWIGRAIREEVTGI